MLKYYAFAAIHLFVRIYSSIIYRFRSTYLLLISRCFQCIVCSFLILFNTSCTSDHPAQVVYLGEKFYGHKASNKYLSSTRTNKVSNKPVLDITPESRELLYKEQEKSDRIIEEPIKLDKKISNIEQVTKNNNIGTEEISSSNTPANNSVKIVSLQNHNESLEKKSKPEATEDNQVVGNIKNQDNKGYIWPLQGKVISTFGIKGKGIKNDGINISSPEGTKIKAISSGKVLYAGNELRGYGNLLIIKQPDGTLVAYAHQKNIIVNKGEDIKQGQIIGYVGMTGNVSTPQLHLAMRKNKKPVNPLDYLN